MADKIKEIHQYSNGVWGDGVPIGADAENIDVDMGEGVTESLQEILGTPSPTPIQTQINELNANKVSTNGGDVANTIVGDQIPIYDTSTQETSEELINTNPSEHSEVIAMQGDTTDTLWGKFNRFRRRVDNKFKNYLVKSIGTGTGYDDNHAYSAKALNTYFANVIGYTAGTTPTAGKISDQLSSLNSKISHVGMIIYSTTLNTQAKVIAIYGGTTWTQITGRFLIATNSSITAKSTGGSSSHTHTTSTHKLTTAELPAHTHGNKSLSGTLTLRKMLSSSGTGTDIGVGGGIVSYKDSSSTYSGAAFQTGTAPKATVFTINASHEHSSVGSGTAHGHGDTGSTNHLPPYYAVYVWERTA